MFLRENEEGGIVAPHLEPGQTLLDLGAGTGYMARWLRSEKGVRPTLADVVDYGNRDRSIPFLKLEDPLVVPAEDGSFDVVLMMFVFHHVRCFEDQELLLDEALRVARHRLIVLEDTPFSRAERVVNAVWDRLLNVRHGVPTPFTFRSADDWVELFKARSLSIAHVESYRPLWPTLKSYHHTAFVLDR